MVIKELFSLKRAVHGPGPVLSRWDPTGRYLATVGINRRFHVFDRTGNLIDEHLLNIARPPLQLEWSFDGSHCAIIQDASSGLNLYVAHQQKMREIDTSMRDGCSFITFSKTNLTLAIGSMKGNLQLFSCENYRAVTIAGKHSKRITCGQWNRDNQLALASLDRMLTISDEKGELKEQAKLKYDPSEIAFSAQKDDPDASNSSPSKKRELYEQPTVSINMGHQTILMYNMNDSENPIELAFQPKYGEIMRYHWFGDGYLMIGFSRGYLIAISTHMKEVGEELQSLKVYESALTNVCYSATLQKLAVCGDDGVKIVDMSDWKEVKSDQVRYTQDEGDVTDLEWTGDGSILTVTTTGGYVISYLTSIPQLSAAHGTRLAYLSSLRVISVFDAMTDAQSDGGTQFSLEVAIEPAFLSLGPSYVACGMNNHAWFYLLQNGECVSEKSYMGSIKMMVMNDQWAAVMYDGKCLLHSIHPDELNEDGSHREDRIFPPISQAVDADASSAAGPQITFIALTNDYLLYSTDKGTLHHWSLNHSSAINEHRHESSITAFYTNPLGTRVIFVDSSHHGFLYSPVDDTCLDIPAFPSSCDAVLFDVSDSACFVALDAKLGKSVVTFIYAAQTTRGPTVTKLSNTKLPYSFLPALFFDGSVHGQKASGALSSLLLSSHDALSITQKGAKRTPEKLRQGLTQLLALNRLKPAWDIALVVKQKEQMLLLARKACDQLDLELALRVYREMKDCAMVRALQELAAIEDKQLLAGSLCLLNGDYNRASTLFLASSQPQQALQMRRDLLQWDQALKLAVTVAPSAIASIAREYAQQLEVKGDYAKALEMYQRCASECEQRRTELLSSRESDRRGGRGSPRSGDEERAQRDEEAEEEDEERTLAAGGIARMTLRLGDLQRGQSLAFASGSKALMKECATILESMRQFSDAADMFARAELYEKACSLYLQTRSFAKSAPLMSKISTPKIHAQYAAAKESEGAYEEAVRAYEKARDFDAMIRLYLFELHEPEKAFALARSTRSAPGAAMIAQYCVEHLDVPSAIEFLFLARRSQEAYEMATKHGVEAMDVYATALGDEDGSTEEYSNLASFYEGVQQPVKAAKYYALLGEYARALKLYCATQTPTAEAMHSAIEVVKKARASAASSSSSSSNPSSPSASGNGEMLVRQLHDYLIGDADGVVKDLNYIFRLYLALGDYKQAASTSLLIANQEQLAGSYSAATAILLDIAQELLSVNVAVPHELNKQLLLLHSYRLAKLNSARTPPDHLAASRMLLRVAKHVSHFPRHAVQILTSTVIECHRAGLKRSAFEVASTLQRPEYRTLIDAKYKKPIESIVRRPTLGEEVEEEQTPCPYCRQLLPRSMVECVACHNDLPWCVVTGEHLVEDDFTQCPSCKFPAQFTAFHAHLSSSGAANKEATCPMCQAAVKAQDLVRLNADEVRAFLYPKERAALEAADAAERADAQRSESSSPRNENHDQNGSSKISASQAIAVKRGQDASAAYSSALDIEVKF